MEIGEKTICKGGQMVTNAMLSYITRINDAFKKNGEKDLKISLALTITPGIGNGNFKLKADINFVAEKITDSFTDDVDELQYDLFEQQETKAVETGSGDLKNCPLRPDDLIFASYCNNNCNLRHEYVSHGTLDADECPIFYYRSCSSWNDDDTKERIESMLEWEPGEYSDVIDSGEGFKFYDGPVAEPAKLSTYRIMNNQTHEWWEGEATDAAEACEKAGWQFGICLIKVKNEGGAWCLCREGEEAKKELPKGGGIGGEHTPVSTLCGKCGYKKAMGNKKHGVTIPGSYGKCTRPEGICLAAQAAITAMKEAA